MGKFKYGSDESILARGCEIKEQLAALRRHRAQKYQKTGKEKYLTRGADEVELSEELGRMRKALCARKKRREE